MMIHLKCDSIIFVFIRTFVINPRNENTKWKKKCGMYDR